MKLVLIEWVDSMESSGWRTIDASFTDEATVCESVGWLLVDGEEVKILVPHKVEAKGRTPFQGCGIMDIPVCAIRSITPLLLADQEGEAQE